MEDYSQQAFSSIERSYSIYGVSIIMKKLICLIVFVSSYLYGQNLDHQKETLMETDRQFSCSNEKYGLGKSLLQFMNEDCILLPEFGHPIRGKEQVFKLMSLYSDLFLKSHPNWKVISVDISNSSEFGYTFGRFAITNMDSVSYDKMKYKYYISVWKYRENAWKLIFQLGLLPLRIKTNVPILALKHKSEDHILLRIDHLFASISKKHGYPEAFFQFIADDGLALGSGGRSPLNKNYYRKLVNKQKEKENETTFELLWEPNFTVLAE